MSFGGSFFGAPRTVLRDLEVDSTTIVVDETNDRVGIGDSAPGTTLQVKGTAPYVTLQNSTAENSDGGCEAKIIFEDHANASLGQIEVSHSGSSDDTKGKMILSTHTGSSLTAAITINEAQKVTAAGDVQVTGDIILDDGGSLKEAGGTAAITFDGDGHVTKIGQDSMSSGDVLTWDGSKFVGEAPTTGDITGVTAGDGLSGGGSSGGVSLALDLNELTDATIADGDSIVFIDANDSNASRKETLADFLDVVAGTAATTGLDRSGATLVLTDLHPVGVSGSNNQLITDDGDGTVTSESGLTYDGSTLAVTGDVTVSGGDITYGNGQNATASVAATAHNAAGKNLTITAGPTTAGTTNNIAGGSLTIQGGLGKGSGAGGDIIFQTANAGSSGSSLNSHATALTISDDLSATFAGEAIISEGNLKLGSTAVGATAAEINAACDASARSDATVAVADDHFLFCDGGATGATKVESIADLMTAVAGVQATTGLTASSGTLVLTDLHPVGVSGSANQVITDDGDGTVTSEAKLLCDGAVTTIGDGTAEDAMLAFDGNAQDFRVGIDDGNDQLEIGHGTTMGTNIAISVNSSGQVTTLNIPAAAVAQASDHIIFLDGGATGAPKAESIDDFLSAIAGSGISVSSSQLTASGGASANDSNTILHMQMFA